MFILVASIPRPRDPKTGRYVSAGVSEEYDRRAGRARQGRVFIADAAGAELAAAARASDAQRPRDPVSGRFLSRLAGA